MSILFPTYWFHSNFSSSTNLIYEFHGYKYLFLRLFSRQFFFCCCCGGGGGGGGKFSEECQMRNWQKVYNPRILFMVGGRYFSSTVTVCNPSPMFSLLRRVFSFVPFP